MLASGNGDSVSARVKSEIEGGTSDVAGLFRIQNLFGIELGGAQCRSISL